MTKTENAVSITVKKPMPENATMTLGTYGGPLPQKFAHLASNRPLRGNRHKRVKPDSK